MRILLAANGFPPATGGTEFCNREIARHLAARGHDLRVVTWTPSDGNGAHWPFPVIRHERGADHDVYSCAGVPRILREFRPDVALISRTTRRLRDLPSLLREEGVPYVAYCHFLRSKHCSRDRVRKYLARRRFGFDDASLVLAVSHCLGEQLERMGVSSGRIRVVHPGVDLERFRPEPERRERVRRELGLDGRTMLLTVARVMDGKGQERVLRVLPRLVAEKPDLVYFVVGGGEILPRLQRLADSLGMREHVVFTGYVPDPVPYYAAADVFALPSNRRGIWIEAFGLSTLEAAACGLPVVASRESGAREIVLHGQTGFLVDESDEGELASALLRLLKDPDLRERYGASARQRAAARMLWPKAVETLEEALREAVNYSWVALGSRVTSAG